MLNTNCGVCDSTRIATYRATDRASLESSDLMISDARYGMTVDLCQCRDCGFIQARDQIDVTRIYEDMVDEEYEATRKQRLLQAKKLLERSFGAPSGRRLLDVGAGSGILLEAAEEIGFRSVGVEPSRWLAARAAERQLTVLEGALPHPQLEGPFDIVTLVDVLEHVEAPGKLIEQAASLMTPGGELLIVTPDVSSILARITGRRWWHFRLAHIGYFNKRTLDLLLGRHGFQRTRVYRPSWYFPISYLQERLGTYCGPLASFKLPNRVREATVPLNLFDSLAVVYKSQGDSPAAAKSQ